MRTNVAASLALLAGLAALYGCACYAEREQNDSIEAARVNNTRPYGAGEFMAMGALDSASDPSDVWLVQLANVVVEHHQIFVTTQGAETDPPMSVIVWSCPAGFESTATCEPVASGSLGPDGAARRTYDATVQMLWGSSYAIQLVTEGPAAPCGAPPCPATSIPYKMWISPVYYVPGS